MGPKSTSNPNANRKASAKKDTSPPEEEPEQQDDAKKPKKRTTRRKKAPQTQDNQNDPKSSEVSVPDNNEEEENESQEPDLKDDEMDDADDDNSESNKNDTNKSTKVNRDNLNSQESNKPENPAKVTSKDKSNKNNNANDDSGSEDDETARAPAGTWLILNGEENKHNGSVDLEGIEEADIMRTIWMGVVVDYPEHEKVRIQWAEMNDSDDVKTWILRDGKTELLDLGCIIGEPAIETTNQFAYFKKKRRTVYRFDPLQEINQSLLRQWLHSDYGVTKNLAVDKRFMILVDGGKLNKQAPRTQTKRKIVHVLDSDSEGPSKRRRNQPNRKKKVESDLESESEEEDTSSEVTYQSLRPKKTSSYTVVPAAIRTAILGGLMDHFTHTGRLVTMSANLFQLYFVLWDLTMYAQQKEIVADMDYLLGQAWIHTTVDWQRFGFNPVTTAVSYTTLTKFLNVNGRSGVSPQVEKLVSLGYIEATGEGTSPKVFKLKLPIPHALAEGKK